MRNEPSEFGVRLRRLREAAGLTQEELAERAGLTAQAVSALERGHRRQPYPNTVRALAAALGDAESNLAQLLAAARPPETDVAAHDDAQPQALAALPSGMVTFLLTDVEGSSTRLWDIDPERMRTALIRHDMLIEQIVAQHTGSVVRARSEGDSRFAVFGRASDAVAAAAAVQVALHQEQWSMSEPFRVRIAVHTGEADLRDGDYFGNVVNRCARLRAVAHGGQVLISEVLAGFVGDGLPEHLSLRDLGHHRLKDLTRAERIFQLTVHGLPHDFPPLVGLDAAAHNLPVQATSLVGREHLLAELRLRLLRPEHRLLTLTGAGGTGKTRVALQLAADVIDTFEHGVWFVDLAPITDAALVLPAIAQVLEVKEEAGRLIAETLKARIGAKSQLLVLDNFEQVLPSAPQVAEALNACPRLKVLVTSRAVLALQGEQVFPVPPLELPDTSSRPDIASLAEIEAVQLFVQRARAARPDFVLNHDNAPSVAAICQRLDGLPLAIELAAARSRLLAPDALLARLDHSLSLLTSGPRDSAHRHQTLRAAIAWSYDLLEPKEQALVRRLAAHVGGWTLEAAEALCNLDADAVLEALDGMGALVDKSLITEVPASQGGNPRFRMLETIREYALERLDSSGESERIHDWHSAYYLDFAELAATQLDGTEQVAWLDRLEDEHDNIRAALAWSMRQQQWATILRLTAALPRFWLVRGHLTEGREHLNRALAASEGVPEQLRARALHASGLLAQYQDDYRLAAAQSTESLAIYRAMDDRPGTVATLQTLGRIARIRGEHAECQSLYEESLAISDQIGDRRTAAVARMGLGVSYWWVSDVARARPLLIDALATFRELDDLRGISESLSNLAFASFLAGDFGSARLLHEEALTMFRQLRDKRGIARSNLGLGHVAMSLGEHNKAAALLQEALHAFTSLGERWLSYGSLIGLARVTLQLEQADIAAHLLGVADALAQQLGTPQRNPPIQAEWLFVDETTTAVRKHTGDERFEAAQSKGRNMTPEQALALLRVELPGADTDASPSASTGA